MFEQKDIDRFWEKVRIKDEDDCWEWIAARDNGYGIFLYKGKTYKAHIFAFTINIGVWPTGLVIRHSCDNPPCCNPNHLLEGTHKDNVHDCIKAGRFKYSQGKPFKKGVEHFNASLTEEEVKKIRQLGWHFTATQIWNMPEWKNKVTRRHINDIINYKYWGHVK